MRKLLLGVALLAPAIAGAQTSQTMPSGAPTVGYPVNVGDGSRQAVQAVTLVDTSGNPASSGGTAVDPRVAQGSTTSGQTGTLVQCAVVTGNQTYTVGQTQPCNLTPTGRLKVGISAATNIAPATLPTTTLESDLVGCIYRATPPTWTDQFTGAVSCDTTGRLLTTGNDIVTNAGTFAVQNTAATPAGSNIIGNVRIDQTTPGTTNGIVVNSGTVTANLGTIAGVSTATNQTTQITAEQAIQAQIGATTSPAAGTSNASLAAILATQQNGNNQVRVGIAASVVDTATAYNLVASSGDGISRPLGTVGGVWNGTSIIAQRGDATGTFTVPQPVATASAGIVPVTAQGATANVLKAAPGNVYSVNVVNSTVAGFLVVYNGTAAPTSGTTISATNGLYCMPVAASVGLRDTFAAPIYASTGAVLLMSTSCTTYTPIGTAPITLTGQAK